MTVDHYAGLIAYHAAERREEEAWRAFVACPHTGDGRPSCDACWGEWLGYLDVVGELECYVRNLDNPAASSGGR
jgi:hypothetical protein